MAKSLKSSIRCGLINLTSTSAIALALVGGAQAAELAFGPVQQVDVKKSTIVVLGQTFHIGASALVTSQANYPARISLGGVSPGALVWVNGTETPSGTSQVQSVITASELNVPGATQLFVAGVVSKVDSVGQVTIGKLLVDVNQTLNSDDALPAVGNFISVVGTQPASGGVFLAGGVAHTQGIGGSSASIGIGGTGASIGIGGTGASIGIGGTGASIGIGGTGASIGIGGTGASIGIGGTG